MTPYEIYCAIHGHFTLGPTGASMTCLRCSKTLDGLGLDPRLTPTPSDPATVVAAHVTGNEDA